ncbi:MAG TPA: aminoacyl-tRNA hydrolase [Spirochaetia bacterium]|nr:aminoacyl-tRNA hydrolase [Spirochaetia bacterium]
MIRLVVFLGNPGPTYSRTRHNAGWMVADALSFAGALDWRAKFKGRFASRSNIGFLKPETLMNRSGESVGACMTFFRINAPDILVVHDDIELELGKVELRAGGGLAGHNGLRDINRVTGTRDFSRLRVGVSRPTHGDVAGYVLSRFAADEEAQLPDILARAAAVIEELVAPATSP